MVEVKRQLPYLSGTLVISSLVSVALYIAGAIRGNDWGFWYMVWNLFLAWLPLIFARILIRTLKNLRWLSWQAILATALWLVFLPNSFYIVSDLIHLREVPANQALFASVMFMSFILNGLLLGYISLYLVHVELRKRWPKWRTRGVIAAILLASSFAIYLGRYLRWNSWDVVRDPAGIIFDVSNRLISPLSYPRMLVTTALFFVLLSTMYFVMCNVVRTLRTGN